MNLHNSSMDSVLGESGLEQFMHKQGQNQWPRYDGYRELLQSRKEIRLLGIWFLRGTENIHGHLYHASLASPPQYEALSYYWGPPDEQRPIVIAGTMLLVAKNLHSFLVALCRCRQNLPIWADSICINQVDVQERSWQVAMMGDIYSQATRVKAWIGDADADSNYALDYVKYFRRGSLEPNEQYRALQERAQQAFRVVAACPYWERMWVIQEIALASELLVLSGSRCVSWYDFCAVMEQVFVKQGLSYEEREDSGKTQIKSTSSMPDSHTHNLARIKRLEAVRRTGRVLPLLQLAANFVDHSSTDPRDKIYSLLGIVEQKADHMLPVDYKKSVIDVFFDTMYFTMETMLPRNVPNDEDFEITYTQFRQDALCVLKGLRISSRAWESCLHDLAHDSRRLRYYDLDHAAGPLILTKVLFGKCSTLSPTSPDIVLRTEERILLVNSTLQRVDQRELSKQCWRNAGLLERNTFCDGDYTVDNGDSQEFGFQICKYAEISPDGTIDKIYVHLNKARILLDILGDLKCVSSSSKLIGNVRVSAASGLPLCRCSGTEATVLAPPAFFLMEMGTPGGF